MLSLLTTLITCAGLGFLVPVPVGPGNTPWVGLRVLLGFCLMLAALFVLHLVFRIPLQGAAWITLAMAGIGIVRFMRPSVLPDLAIHPVILLSLAVLADLAVRGLNYSPLAWDELSNWLAWTRQSVATGRLLGPDIRHGVMGYTPGWPLALAFPSLLAGGFSFNRVALVPFVMHVAVLGLVFDTAVAAMRQRGTALREARLGSWAIVLLLLAAEATWKLVPTHMLIEEPQSYLLLAWLLVAWLMLEGHIEQRIGALFLGIIFLGGYLIKVAMLAFGPAGLVLLAWAWFRRRAVASGSQAGSWLSLLELQALAFGPAVIAYGIWRVTGWLPSCISEPLSVVTSILAHAGTAERAADLFARLFGWILGYLETYKWPLTAAGLGAVAILSRARGGRPVVLACLIYIALYFGSLYLYHMNCFGEYYFKTLNSPDRFTRVPLRLLHVAGILVPAVPLTVLALGRAIGRRLLVAVLIFLAAWQAWKTDGAVRALTTRWDAAPQQATIVAQMRGDAERIAALVAARPELGRDVRLIVQGDDGYHQLILTFFADSRFAPRGAFSWGEVPANIWMSKADAESVMKDLSASSLIWPVRVDPWISEVIGRHLDDAECRSHLEARYLVPRPGGGFACFGKP